MDGSVHATSAKERRVGCIDDRFTGFLGDVGGAMELDGLADRQDKADCEIAHSSSLVISACR
jgi:hypothetical protein